jgi:hypothetical protein
METAMEGFLIHTDEADMARAMNVLRRSGKPIKLSGTLCAVRTGTPAQLLLDQIKAALPNTANVLIARTNGAYVHGSEPVASAAKLLG